MRAYVTYFDRNYAVRGLALIESLRRHDPGCTIYVVCLDEITRTLLRGLGLEVELVPLHAIEQRDDALAAARNNRTTVEYYWTLTPVIIQWLLERRRDLELVTYVDADLYFFSSPEPIFAELGDDSVLIHEHRYSPDLLALADNGRFNVGLLCFKNDARAHAVLSWWKDKCLDWCHARAENGKMGDQGYLEDWPSRFEGVAVLQHVGAGVAPWNHSQYRYGPAIAQGQSGDAAPRVNDRPLVFYHFHALSLLGPSVIVPSKHLTYALTAAVLRLCFVPYAEALGRAAAALGQRLSGFEHGLASPGVLTEEHTFLAPPRAAAALADLPLKQRRVSLCDGWDVYVSRQLVTNGSIQHCTTTPLAPSEGTLAVVARGADTLQAAFPRARFIETARPVAGLNAALALSTADVLLLSHGALPPPESLRQLETADVVRPHHGVMWLRRSALERVGALDPSLEVAEAFEDFCRRAAKLARRVASTPPLESAAIEAKWRGAAAGGRLSLQGWTDAFEPQRDGQLWRQRAAMSA